MHHSHIDKFAQQDSPIHRLDARAKFLAVLAYTAVLVSYHRYALLELAPLAIFPAALVALSGVPAGFVLKRVLALCPLAMMLALAAILYDPSPRAVALADWRWTLPGGVLTAGNLAAKFILAVTAMTAVMCATPFSLLLEAMRRLALPAALTLLLGFLYRYLFVLSDQAMRLRRARDFRGAALAPMSRRLAASGGMIGSLFVRTLDRSERVGLAMAARGFTGQPHSLRRLGFGRGDVVFLAAVAVYLAVCRFLLA
jgi:cobalt/nickel transport system permease protein